MNLRDVIVNGLSIDEDLVLYAKKVDGKLLPSSEAVLLELTEEERDLETDELAKKKCPGFRYCMEMFLIHELLQDLETMDIDKKVERVIYYIEYDA